MPGGRWRVRPSSSWREPRYPLLVSWGQNRPGWVEACTPSYFPSGQWAGRTYVSVKGCVCVMGGQWGPHPLLMRQWDWKGALRLPSLALMAKFSSTNLWHLL